MAKPKKELVETPPGRTASFLRLERNLNIIGFFSASKKRGTQARTIEAKRQVDGKTYVAKTTILPSPEHGLPNTSDQDKYFALMHLVNQIKMREGVVKNPITFTSSDLVRILGLSWSGDIGHEIRTWLERLVATTIKSEGSIYLPQRKRYMSDTYHAFDRVIISGDELPNGVISETHQVFFSEWLLESFNRNYVFPIEMEGYRKLKSPLAKTLVPHLQIWLYASRSIRRFEKRYSDICVICDIEVCKYLSHIKRQLEMSMEELRAGGYIAAWMLKRPQMGAISRWSWNMVPSFLTINSCCRAAKNPPKRRPMSFLPFTKRCWIAESHLQWRENSPRAFPTNNCVW